MATARTEAARGAGSNVSLGFVVIGESDPSARKSRKPTPPAGPRVVRISSSRGSFPWEGRGIDRPETGRCQLEITRSLDLAKWRFPPLRVRLQPLFFGRKV